MVRSGYKNGYSAHPVYFEYLRRVLAFSHRFRDTLCFSHLRSITECERIIGPPKTAENRRHLHDGTNFQGELELKTRT
jgi:hypothetical protein